MINKIFYLIFFLFLTYGLISQTVNVSYPKNVESYVGQTINLPIICENLTNQTLNIFPDYHSVFYDSRNGYQLNRMSPRQINAGRRELIFVNLSPSASLKAGKRFFPFVLKDVSGTVVYSGVFEIDHKINESFEMIPISNYRYLFSDSDEIFSFLFFNSGTVPVEFKTNDLNFVRVIHPGQVDTLNIKFSDISSVERNEYWVSFIFSYTLTTIKPNELLETNHTMHHFIPVAYRTGYPLRKDYMDIPINFSQSFSYDENSFGFKHYSRFYHASLYGNGYLDGHDSPYLSYLLNYRYNDYGYMIDREFKYHVLYRSLGLSFEVGEGAYILDLKRQQKYGEGYYIGYNLYGLFFEGTFLQELYNDKPVHSAYSIGYAWDVDSSLYEPQTYARFRYYQKNSEQHENQWWKIGGHESFEHQKLILESQVRVNNFKLHLEIFNAKDDEEADFGRKTGVSAEIMFNTPYLYNRFSMLYDNINIVNETDFRKNFQNDMNITSEILDLYTTFQYQEDLSHPAYALPHQFNTINLSLNAYLKYNKEFYFRGKFFHQNTDIIIPTNTEFRTGEVMIGQMYKNSLLEAEGLFGIKYEKWGNYHDVNLQIIDLNLAMAKLNPHSFNVNLNNRINLFEDEFTILSFLNVFYRWNHVLSQTFGTYNHYNSVNTWRNNLSTFTNLFFRMPWQHDLRLGISYNVNPSFRENYLFSVMAEYSMPFSFNLIPVSNRKYMNISVFDPWEKKPVTDAVMYIDNRYHVTNEVGLVRARKSELRNQPVQIINMPTGFTTHPDLSILSNHKGNKINLQIVNFSKLTVDVQKVSYERVHPMNAHNYKNIAYFQNTLINLDKFDIVTCSDPLELVLRNVKNPVEIHRATINSAGTAEFINLKEGEYNLFLNTNVNSDFYLDNENIIIKIIANENSEYELLVREKVTRFTRFE